jgi:hypothetical protein
MKGFLLLLVCCILNSKEEVPHGAQKLIKAYSEKISHYKDNKIFFKDGSSLVYDDGKPKNMKLRVLTMQDVSVTKLFSRRFTETLRRK